MPARMIDPHHHLYNLEENSYPWPDLHEEGVADVLERHCEFANIRGVRQILLSHSDARFNLSPRADLLTDSQWRDGFALLKRHGLSFDLQVYPHQMADAADLAASFPDTQIVLDHAGLPIEFESVGLR